MSMSDHSVNRLGALGNLLQGTKYKENQGTARTAPPRHVITISREAGALGTTVARALGERLGWPVYDHEMLDRVGKEMGLDVDMVKLIDEKPMSWLEECIVALVSQYNLSHDRYMIRLTATVRSLGEQGNCVIVGRGANFLLPRETTVNVRLVGDQKDRVAHTQRKLNLSEKEAGRWVEKTDSQRQEFIKRHFGKEVGYPLLYDLVLNTSRLSADDCTDVIIAALHRIQARKPVGVAVAAT